MHEPKAMVKPPTSFMREKWTKLDQYISIALFILHILCIFAPFHFNWRAFWVSFALYVITGLSISVSYHRNLAHKSFELPKLLEYFFAYCAAHALQGDPIDWVSTHRCHHQFVDTERDPHSPVQGFWFSHILWLFDSYTLTKRVCPKYFTNFKKIERSIIIWFSKHGRPDNVRDLEKQAFYRFIHKTYLLHHVAFAVLLYEVGGLPFLIWGMCVRIVVLLHITFMVNSVCHIWGKRRWNTKDLSKNNWLVGLLAFGEGWHNNHHAFEYSARFGIEWWEYDPGWYVIRFLQAIGVATQVKLPSQIHKQRLIHKPVTPSIGI
ncbi:palmitoyl-monogalactosyldiacylglycerol delta-7 desaturase, chloroplastic-like isoform X1 [Cucurbita pepo subsp. pepo]|uniref:palmitoyl-monogalactosyldiacylglycerol delta-7 desaturase, chloroplastic-like isoform X1 n=1 Tax=Cucurbita pepo subsp. pepo TaxID=3664 RepID=UPI000C9D2EA4|nr:palmitoyl-monogalactosyldiacylglycerol delta-7 desaturase, chloroplastic-like isoform X1 [Cucurbita pepo subsp. pepo]